MLYMLDDFLSLYNFKKQMAVKYTMPQNITYLLAVGLENIVLSWLGMCVTRGKHPSIALREEIVRVCSLPEVRDAVAQKDFVKQEPTGIRKAIQDGDVEAVTAFVMDKVVVGQTRKSIKAILK